MAREITRRLFIAATSQNDGKTSCSIGLLDALSAFTPAIGFMKPVGQRYVTVDGADVDEDVVLIKRITHCDCALKDMNPVAVPQYFTREYLDDPSVHPQLVQSISDSFARIAACSELVVVEGTGHAGVGSVFDLSNAQVAHQLDADVVLVTLGGIGHPVDEVALNRCLFEREGVRVLGVIANKVLPSKQEQTREYLGKALSRMGLPLLGVIPYTSRLTWPTVRQVADATKSELIHGIDYLDNPVAEVVIGAMTPHNALTFIRDNSLLIVPGDRDDLVLAAATLEMLRDDLHIAGILFTGDMLPEPQTLDLLTRTRIPALAVKDSTYEAAARVQKLTVKIQVSDEEKIRLARRMVIDYVDVNKIWESL